MDLAKLEAHLKRMRRNGATDDTEVRLGEYGGGSSSTDGVYMEDDKKIIIH